MGKHTTEDPLLVDSKKADKQGRVFLGSEFAGKEVRLVIEDAVEKTDGEEDSAENN